MFFHQRNERVFFCAHCRFAVVEVGVGVERTDLLAWKDRVVVVVVVEEEEAVEK